MVFRSHTPWAGSVTAAEEPDSTRESARRVRQSYVIHIGHTYTMISMLPVSCLGCGWTRLQRNPRGIRAYKVTSSIKLLCSCTLSDVAKASPKTVKAHGRGAAETLSNLRAEQCTQTLFKWSPVSSTHIINLGLTQSGLGGANLARKDDRYATAYPRALRCKNGNDRDDTHDY